MRIDFVDKAARTAFVSFAKDYLATRKNYDEKPYDVPSLPEWSLIESALIDMSLDCQRQREELRLCKKGVVVCVKDAASPEGRALYVHSMPYSPANVQKVRAKYGGDLMEIVNERLGLPLVDDETARLTVLNAHYKKLCKASLLYTLKNPDGTRKDLKQARPYSAAAAAELRARHPTDLLEIINERFL